MKITDINMHNLFVDRDLRNFFSQSLVDADWTDKISNDTIIARREQINQIGPENKFDQFIATEQLEIDIHQNNLERLVKRKAIYELMKSRGWTDFDVSDEVGRVGDYFHNFIGTPEEYEALIDSLSK